MSGIALLADEGAHRGPLPPVGDDFIAELERSGLRGRGGAAFLAATKWRAVAAQRSGAPSILVNGGEGEPLSRKDRVLMETRPHLILDGAAVAARVLRARDIVHYVGAEHAAAVASMKRALAERPVSERDISRLVSAPVGYVAGEESAAVHFVNDGTAVPTTIPPRPYERGIGGRPTLVQNVETLAQVALIARHGSTWFAQQGVDGAGGTALVTVSEAVAATQVVEVRQGSTVADAVNAAGGLTTDCHAVLLGGYFGSWLRADEAWGTRLDAAALRDAGLSLGCGVIGVLPADRCGVMTTARVIAYLAHESSRQCGPCTFGLRAIAAATGRLATMLAAPDDLERIQRWSGLLGGRGACKHPDGAATFLQSALRVFAGEFSAHHVQRACFAPVPAGATA